MNLTLRTVRQDELSEFKKEMQRAFQLGAEAEYGETDMQILPESDKAKPPLNCFRGGC